MSHFFSSTRPRRKTRRRKRYGLQFHPLGTTAASENCLLPPQAGGPLRQNPGKIGLLIQAVRKVISAPARFWNRGARCFVERLYVLEQLGDELQRFFGGDSLALLKQGRFWKCRARTKVASSRAARGNKREERKSRHRWRLEDVRGERLSRSVMEWADSNSAEHERELEPNGFAVSRTPSTHLSPTTVVMLHHCSTVTVVTPMLTP